LAKTKMAFGKDNTWYWCLATINIPVTHLFNGLRSKHKFYKEVSLMGTAIEYQKLMSEIVYINLPGPQEPTPGMTGGELLHGFLAELHRMSSPDMQGQITALASKWNIHYRNGKG